MSPDTRKLMQHRFIVPLLLIVFALLTVRIDGRWFGHHEPNGTWISVAVRNINWYGSDIHYLPVITASPADVDDFQYYLHHPPGVVWVSTLAAQVFGTYDDGKPLELSIRIVSILATMLSLALFYVIVRRLFDEQLALIAMALYALTPMTLFFGRMPNHEPIALVLVYAFIAVQINWLRRYTRWRSLVLLLLAVGAMWVAWAAAFFFFTSGVITLIYGDKRHRRDILLIGFVTALATVAIPLFYEALVAGSLQELYDYFIYRSSTVRFERIDDVQQSFSIFEFIGQNTIHMLTAMSLGVMLFGTISILQITRQFQKFAHALIIALLAAPFLYTLVFRNAVFLHDFYKIYFMVGYVIAAALLIRRLWGQPPQYLKRFAKPLVIGILGWSLILGGAWWGLLHLAAGEEQELGAIADDLPVYTMESDITATYLTERRVVEYYSYRNLLWEVGEEQALEQGADYYLHCGETYNGIFSDRPYTIIANGQCRLMDINDS